MRAKLVTLTLLIVTLAATSGEEAANIVPRTSSCDGSVQQLGLSTVAPPHSVNEAALSTTRSAPVMDRCPAPPREAWPAMSSRPRPSPEYCSHFVSGPSTVRPTVAG